MVESAVAQVVVAATTAGDLDDEIILVTLPSFALSASLRALMRPDIRFQVSIDFSELNFASH